MAADYDKSNSQMYRKTGQLGFYNKKASVTVSETLAIKQNLCSVWYCIFPTNYHFKIGETIFRERMDNTYNELKFKNENNNKEK